MSHRRAISESWRTCEAIPARHRSSGDTSYLCRCTQVSTAAGYRHTSGEVALRMNWCTCMQGSSCGNQRPPAPFVHPRRSAPICANLRQFMPICANLDLRKSPSAPICAHSWPSTAVRLACAPHLSRLEDRKRAVIDELMLGFVKGRVLHRDRISFRPRRRLRRDRLSSRVPPAPAQLEAKRRIEQREERRAERVEREESQADEVERGWDKLLACSISGNQWQSVAISGILWQSVAVGEALAYSLEGPPSQSVPISFVTRLLP